MKPLLFLLKPRSQMFKAAKDMKGDRSQNVLFFPASRFEQIYILRFLDLDPTKNTNKINRIIHTRINQ